MLMNFLALSDLNLTSKVGTISILHVKKGLEKSNNKSIKELRFSPQTVELQNHYENNYDPNTMNLLH